MLAFLRRRRGSARHGLGPAVTAIPTAPVAPELPAPVLPAAVLPVSPAPVPHAPAQRVELGFRDGTTTELEPSSAQAQALQELAQLLRTRD